MYGVHWHPTQQPINGPSGILRDVRSAVGSVRVRLDSGHEITLTDVEYMPTAPNNILSVRHARRDGMRFGNNEFGEIIAIVYLNGVV